jgi:hypothetical protein
MPRELTPENVFESLCQKIEMNQHVTNEALKHHEIMLDKTNDSFEKRLKELNGVRETFREYTATAIPRTEANARFDALAEKQADALKPIQTKLDVYGKPNYNLWLAAATVIAGIIGGAWLVINLEISVVSAPLQLATESLKVADVSRDRQLRDLGELTQRNAQEILSLNQVTGSGKADRLQLNDRLRIAEAAVASSNQADAASRSDRAQLNDRLKTIDSMMSLGLAERKQQYSEMNGKLIEVETQFKSASNTMNVMKDESEQWLSILWPKVFPEQKFPPSNFRPQLFKDH